MHDWHAKSDWIQNEHAADCSIPYLARDPNDNEGSQPNDQSSTTGAIAEPGHIQTPNERQNEVIELYKDFLLNPPGSIHTEEPPPVVLLTGGGGTGKSFVIHELLKLGNSGIDVTVWTAANNNLNAADIDGCTIASMMVLKHPIEKNKNQTDGQHAMQPEPMKKIVPEAVSALQDRNIMKLLLLIIDEISNVTAEKLGQLSRLISRALENSKDFGGVRILLVGDYNQKKPIGEIATKTSLKHIGNSKQAQTFSRRAKTAKRQRKTSQRKKQSQDQKSESLFSSHEHNCISDATLGCKILSNARWFELTQAERSKDDRHNGFLQEMYSVGKELDPLMFATTTNFLTNKLWRRTMKQKRNIG